MKPVPVAFGLLVATVATAGATDILKAEPPAGKLPYLKVVYVDDGSCPAGQIKKLVGGNGSDVPRKRSCVKRP
ncbi:DUF6719 family protein [Ancylobacter sp. G4_0304]|uniref:DUF6719 family protein n=1 Tax=Ancylobacter sp. G4_0304 TaxID=3114289 RepID=UPI0039C724F7